MAKFISIEKGQDYEVVPVVEETKNDYVVEVKLVTGQVALFVIPKDKAIVIMVI